MQLNVEHRHMLTFCNKDFEHLTLQQKVILLTYIVLYNNLGRQALMGYFDAIILSFSTYNLLTCMYMYSEVTHTCRFINK